MRDLGFAFALEVLLAAGLPVAYAEDATHQKGMHRAASDPSADYW